MNIVELQRLLIWVQSNYTEWQLTSAQMHWNMCYDFKYQAVKEHCRETLHIRRSCDEVFIALKLLPLSGCKIPDNWLRGCMWNYYTTVSLKQPLSTTASRLATGRLLSSVFLQFSKIFFWFLEGVCGIFCVAILLWILVAEVCPCLTEEFLTFCSCHIEPVSLYDNGI